MKTEKLIIHFKQSRFILLALFFIVGVYNTQCQNSNHTTTVTKTSTIKKDTPMKLNPLTEQEKYVILNKGTVFQKIHYNDIDRLKL